MSDRDNDAGFSGADDDASLFSQIVGNGETVSDAQDQHGDEQRAEGDEGGEDDGQGGTRERDGQGRFAKPEPRQEARRDGQGEDRAQRGLRKEVTSERGRRQQTETELQAERREREADRQELARLRGMVEQYTRQAPQPQGQQQAEGLKVEATPDRYTDPEGYDKWVIGQAEQRAQAFIERQAVQRADYALDHAKQRDPQGFEAAVATLKQLDPQANAAVRQRMLLVPDAGAFLLDWHKQEQARREIGGDPNGFRERVRTEALSNPAELMKDPAFAQAVTDYLRQQAGQGGRDGGPRTETRLPPSLNGSRGSNVQRGSNYGNSDRDVFEEVMRT